MSLDLSFHRVQLTEVASHNITHNLTKMASAAGVYDCLWRPLETGHKVASDIIKPLEDGLALLKERPDHFRQYNSPNGWGLYENFVSFVEDVLKSAKEYPDAELSACV